jgi:acyl-CoA thioester hydrolase
LRSNYSITDIKKNINFQIHLIPGQYGIKACPCGTLSCSLVAKLRLSVGLGAIMVSLTRPTTLAPQEAMTTTTTQDAPLALYQHHVQSDWIDYNGHMSEGFYAIAFGDATDKLMDHIGMDAPFRERVRFTIYTMETHISYLLEMAEGEALSVTTHMLEHDQKRMRIFHAMMRESGMVTATQEAVLLNVDMRGPKAAPFDPAVMAKIEAVGKAHAELAWHPQAGRAIALKR